MNVDEQEEIEEFTLGDQVEFTLTLKGHIIQLPDDSGMVQIV